MGADAYSSLEAIAAKVDMLEALRDIEPIWVDDNGVPQVCDAYARRFCNEVRSVLFRMCSYCNTNPTDHIFTAEELSQIENSINTIACKFNDAGGLADVHGRASWLEVSLQEASKYLKTLAAIIEKNARNQQFQRIASKQPEQAEKPKRKAGRREANYNDYIIAQYLRSAVLKRIDKDLKTASTAEEAYCIMRAAMAIGVFLNNENDKMPFSAIQRRFGIFPNDRPQNNKDSQKRLNRIENLKSIYEQLKPS